MGLGSRNREEPHHRVEYGMSHILYCAELRLDVAKTNRRVPVPTARLCVLSDPFDVSVAGIPEFWNFTTAGVPNVRPSKFSRT
jgi:hypothetical protein